MNISEVKNALTRQSALYRNQKPIIIGVQILLIFIQTRLTGRLLHLPPDPHLHYLPPWQAPLPLTFGASSLSTNPPPPPHRNQNLSTQNPPNVPGNLKGSLESYIRSLDQVHRRLPLSLRNRGSSQSRILVVADVSNGKPDIIVYKWRERRFMRDNREWRSFKNGARGDGLRLSHWAKAGSDPEAGMYTPFCDYEVLLNDA